MSTPRRRLVRPFAPSGTAYPQSNRQTAKLRGRLEAERTALSRWMTRLKRAFHAVEKSQLRIRRLEHLVARREG